MSEWLGVSSAGTLLFDDSYRPVPLDIHVRGVAKRSVRQSYFHFVSGLMYELPAILPAGTSSRDQPVLVVRQPGPRAPCYTRDVKAHVAQPSNDAFCDEAPQA